MTVLSYRSELCASIKPKRLGASTGSRMLHHRSWLQTNACSVGEFLLLGGTCKHRYCIRHAVDEVVQSTQLLPLLIRLIVPFSLMCVPHWMSCIVIWLSTWSLPQL